MENTRSRKSKSFIIKRRKENYSPKLSHDEIDKAVQAFLNNGGKIEKIADIGRNYQEIMAGSNGAADVDDFLMGR